MKDQVLITLKCNWSSLVCHYKIIIEGKNVKITGVGYFQIQLWSDRGIEVAGIFQKAEMTAEQIKCKICL